VDSIWDLARPRNFGCNSGHRLSRDYPDFVEYEMHWLMATRLDKTKQSLSQNWKRSLIAQFGGDRVLDPGIVVRRGLPDCHASRHPHKRMEESVSHTAG
jgi:hypothetical protein